MGVLRFGYLGNDFGLGEIKEVGINDSQLDVGKMVIGFYEGWDFPTVGILEFELIHLGKYFIRGLTPSSHRFEIYGYIIIESEPIIKAQQLITL
jgi:hypothetical protein